jgi:hypothetical protein
MNPGRGLTQITQICKRLIRAGPLLLIPVRVHLQIRVEFRLLFWPRTLFVRVAPRFVLFRFLGYL